MLRSKYHATSVRLPKRPESIDSYTYAHHFIDVCFALCESILAMCFAICNGVHRS